MRRGKDICLCFQLNVLRGLERGADPKGEQQPRKEDDMQHVSAKDLVSAIPVQMTKKEKLLRWAELVREHRYNICLYSNLEYMTKSQRDTFMVTPEHRTAFSVAIEDPTFKEQGLTSHTLSNVLKFFDLSVAEAHAFSCDCGGTISNKEQAARIEYLVTVTSL